jgi:hypothetical protein
MINLCHVVYALSLGPKSGIVKLKRLVADSALDKQKLRRTLDE